MSAWERVGASTRRAPLGGTVVRAARHLQTASSPSDRTHRRPIIWLINHERHDSPRHGYTPCLRPVLRADEDRRVSVSGLPQRKPSPCFPPRDAATTMLHSKAHGSVHMQTVMLMQRFCRDWPNFFPVSMSATCRPAFAAVHPVQ